MDKHSSLLRTFVNCSRKRFMRLAEGPNVTKHFVHTLGAFPNNLECLLDMAGKAFQGQTHQLITNIHKLHP
jgi:hypothetical protein